MQPKRRALTFEEYCTLDDAAPQGVRLEYWDGQVLLKGQPFDPEWGWDAALDMAGATPEHAGIAAALSFALQARLRGRCHVYVSDLRVHVGGGRYTYPDVVVVCGEQKFDTDKPMLLLNPTLLVEVVSPSSVYNDKVDKLRKYTRIESLRAYWVFEQDAPVATRYIRQGDEWIVRIEGGPDTIMRSDALGIEIPLDEIYP